MIKITKLFPQTLTWRLILTSVVVLFSVQLIIITVFMLDMRRSLADTNYRITLTRIISTVRVLDHNDPSIYHEFIKTRISHGLFANISTNPVIPENRNHGYEDRIKSEINDENREIYIRADSINDISTEKYVIPREGSVISDFHYLDHNRKIVPEPVDAEKPQTMHLDNVASINDNNPFDDKVLPAQPPRRSKIYLYGSIKLKTGYYLTFVGYEPDTILPRLSSITIYCISLVTVIGTLLFYLLVTGLTRPLKKLMYQAVRISSDYKTAPLEIQGPKEIQDLQKSFNKMQENLVNFIDDRTRILASISHDLKTPLTSLRLRSEFLEDSEDTQKMRETIDTMTKMVKATLLFARGDEQTEEARELHLPSLIESICNNYIDTGKDLTYEEQGNFRRSLNFYCSTTDIHRLLQNLIDNAFQYGSAVKVIFKETDKAISIQVIDNGPGIPEEKIEDVFSPFMRLDEARNTSDAHVGLGLSIVRNIVIKQGGTIKLSNIKPHGLSAEIIYNHRSVCAGGLK